MNEAHLVEEFKKDRNIPKLSKSLLELIKLKGFVHIDQEASYALFLILGENMGEILLENDIKISKEGRFAASRCDEIFPHTDTSDAHIMGWWCQRQDEIDGSSILVDTQSMKEYFSQAELEELQNMYLQYTYEHHRTSDNFTKFDQISFIYERWGELKMNYAPWTHFAPSTPYQKDLADKAKAFLDDISQNQLTSIRLKEGEILFIDNGRFLHSRNKIASNSLRCLKRLWIKTRG